MSVSPNGRFAYVTWGIDIHDYSELTVLGRDPASGALTPLPPPDGCVSAYPDRGCGAARAFEFNGVPSFSPDGREAYIGSGYYARALISAAADPASGRLTQLPGPAGCTTRAPRNDCAIDPVVSSATAPVVASDGLHAYAASRFAPGTQLVTFTRDPLSGALHLAACLSSRPTPGCVLARGMGRTIGAFEMSPNGRTLYVAFWDTRSVATFRVARDGTLRQFAGKDGCVSGSIRERRCRRAHGLFQPASIQISPDGRTVYVVDVVDRPFGRNGDILTFSAAASNGALKQLPGRYGCLNRGGNHGCTRVRGLRGGLGASALSPDGRYLYVPSDAVPGTEGQGSLAVFRPTPSRGR
jgi:hypothetical protein